VDYFDLIAGTSTGGIIALCLGLGLPAESVATFYKRHGPRLFREWWGVSLLGCAKHLLFAKHSARRLQDALTGIFGDRRLGEASTRLVIPAFHVVEGQVHLFKTAHDARFARDCQLSAVDVAMATSAAPTFLPARLVESGDELVDGGVWANCPVLVGVIEAIRFLGKRPEELSVLSVGTTNGVFAIPKRTRRWGGVLPWGPHVVQLMMAGQASAALAQAGLLLGKGRITRIDETVPQSRARLDDWRHLDELEGRASFQARHRGGEIEKAFFRERRAEFVPVKPGS